MRGRQLKGRMNKQDRQVVESGRVALEAGVFDMYKDTGPKTSVKALIAIVDRLDAQLQKILKTGEWVKELCRELDKRKHDPNTSKLVATPEQILDLAQSFEESDE